MIKNVSSILRTAANVFIMRGKKVPSTSIDNLSSKIHDQWISWAKSLSSKEDLSEERVDRWKKLFVPYDMLSEEEKDKDREFALKFLNSVKNDILSDVYRGYLATVGENWGYILPEELQNLFKSGEIKNFNLIDLRKPGDYSKGHIPGSINIFWLDMMDNLDKIPKDKPLIVYCYLGHTSSQALVMLRTLGYDVRSLKFGLGQPPKEGIPVKGWLDFGYEVVR